MARASHIQTNFTAGELSPRLDGRVDLQKYQNGARLLENMIVLPHGGITRRPGFRFVAETRDAAQKVRLIPFEFSAEQAYVLELGDRYMRFYRDRGRLEVDGVTSTVSNGGFETGISGWTDASTAPAAISHDGAGQRMVLTGSGGNRAIARQSISCQANALHVLLFRVVAGAAEISVGTSAGGGNLVDARRCVEGWHSVEFTPQTGTIWLQFASTSPVAPTAIDSVAFHAAAPLELETPYSIDAIAALKVVQSADVMFLAHGDHPVHRLARLGNRSWSLSAMEFSDGPYLSENIKEDHKLALTGTAVDTSVTITASGFEPFLASDVGRAVRIKHDANWGWARITAYVSATQVTAIVGGKFDGTEATATWRLGAWGGPRGFPRAITFFEQRLFLGGTYHQPQTVWGSQSANYASFSPTRRADADPFHHAVTDDSAVTYTIASDQVNTIRWLSPARDLIVGTLGAEFRLGAGDAGKALTPSSVLVRRETAHGVADLQPLRAGSSVLFVQRAERKIRELGYSFEVDGYVAPDLTLLAEHITASGIADMAYQQEPDGIVWSVLRNGDLVGLTYQRAQEVIAWHRHRTAGRFESIAVIPDALSLHDQLWACVARTVGGVEKRFVEYLEGGWEESQNGDAAEYFSVDSGLSYRGAATQSLGGLGHLAGSQVAILADGAAHPDGTVGEGGELALQRAASTVHAGLPFVARVETLRLEAGAADGTAQGKTKRIHEVTVRLMRTGGLRIGPRHGSIDPVPFRSSAAPMGQPPGLLSGDVEIELDAGFDTYGGLVLEQRQPLPCTILALMPRVNTSDGG